MGGADGVWFWCVVVVRVGGWVGRMVFGSGAWGSGIVVGGVTELLLCSLYFLIIIHLLF